MALYKTSKCPDEKEEILASSSVYNCSACDHMEVITGSIEEGKTCPKCNEPMMVISSSSGPDDTQDNDDRQSE